MVWVTDVQIIDAALYIVIFSTSFGSRTISPYLNLKFYMYKWHIKRQSGRTYKAFFPVT